MSIEDDANGVVENYVDKRMRDAHMRIQELQRKRSISQRDAVSAVTEWNTWLRWLLPQQDCKDDTFVVKKGKHGEISIKKWGEE
jgi:hypothetical protein